MVRMLNLSRPKCLALDRTNWKVGCKDINILMLAIVTRRFRAPLLWTVIDHQGNSNTGQRIELMRRYSSLFGAASIELLLADREFIGADWVKFLMENKVPFGIRVKQGQCVALADGWLSGQSKPCCAGAARAVPSPPSRLACREPPTLCPLPSNGSTAKKASKANG